MALLFNCFVSLQFVARMDATISEASPDTACTGQAVNAVAVSKGSVNSDGTVRMSVSATVVSEAVVSRSFLPHHLVDPRGEGIVVRIGIFL